jgi:hypothetical protein
MFEKRLLLALLLVAPLAGCGEDDKDASNDDMGVTGGTPGGGDTPPVGGTPGGGDTPPVGGTPGGGDTPPVGGTPVEGPIEVSGELTGDVSWPAGAMVTLTDHVFVKGTLTIGAGAKIFGQAGTSLVITREGRINAVGTAAAPIVFTSAEPEGSRTNGDWGGVVLLGNAPINVDGGEEKIEGFADDETRTAFGGGDAAHNCGTLEYVRVEFAGFELSPDNELNGISVGGCGTGTKLDYIQIHKGADDGIEFFGGTTNVSHLVVTQANDDSVDWDYGWNGLAQFIVIQQSAVDGNNGFEADNQKDNNDAMPRSMPKIWNATVIGSGVAAGEAGATQAFATLRRGTAGQIHNAIIAHFADRPYNIADEATVAQIDADALKLTHSIFFSNAGANEVAMAPETGDDDDDGGYDDNLFANDAADMNRFVDPMLEDALNLDAPNFMVKAGSPALTGGKTPMAGDTTATYVGAFGATDWTAGWTAYPAN